RPALSPFEKPLSARRGTILCRALKLLPLPSIPGKTPRLAKGFLGPAGGSALRGRAPSSSGWGRRSEARAAWEHLDALTRRFEHRSSTTAHERAAARWLADRLRQLGYQVGEHPFQAPRETLYTGPPLVGGAILLLAWLLERLPSPWSWLALVGAGAR